MLGGMVDVLISANAQKQLKPLPVAVKKQVLRAVKKLAQWPDVAQVVKLAGRQGYRIRAGQYRVIFSVHHKTITVTSIKPRGSAYKP